MTSTPPEPDPVMGRITRAVADGRRGDTGPARQTLHELWSEIGVLGDPLHRCTLAHHMADLHDDPAEALVWDVRALDAADATTRDRARAHHPGLDIAGFYPSLHLNLADDHRRLGSFAAAAEHIALAEQAAPALADDGYGHYLRGALDKIGAAVERRDTGRTDLIVDAHG